MKKTAQKKSDCAGIVGAGLDRDAVPAMTKSIAGKARAYKDRVRI